MLYLRWPTSAKIYVKINTTKFQKCTKIFQSVQKSFKNAQKYFKVHNKVSKLHKKVSKIHIKIYGAWIKRGLRCRLTPSCALHAVV